MRAFLFAGLALLLAAAPALARERILDFHSQIEVRADGGLEVTETIEVVAEHVEIRRGIIRDFPTDYRDRLGNRVTVGFDVVQVKRNGASEPWFTERAGNGVRLYIGDRDVIIPRGNHVYEITYRTTHQVAFYEDHDELYWNVTGTGWSFVIERASAAVILPGGAEALALNAWTGPQGATAQDFTASGLGRNAVSFAATAPLDAREGLTIAVAWPKGFIEPPTAAEQAGRLLRDNLGAGIGWLGLLLIAVFYLVIWHRVGRDPQGGAVYPRFKPPTGLSPAALRFVRRMGIDDKVLTAAVLSLAVKGHLEIEERGKGDYVLRRRDGDERDISAGERILRRRLFSGSPVLEIEQANHSRLRGAESALTDFLQGEYEGAYFRRNRGQFIAGITFSAVLLVLSAAAHIAFGDIDAALPSVFLSLWLGFWTFACYKLGSMVVNTWRAARGGFANTGKAIFLTIFATPFFIGWIAGAFGFLGFATLGFGVPLVLILGINGLFYELLKAPTRAGRRLLDEIEGFALYLGTAEGPRLEAMHPPDMSPEHFEKLLPYAVALDLEVPWSERFEGALAAGKFAGAEPGGYHPMWYRGHGWRGFSAGSFASGIGSSMTSSIASASTPPGSSSSGGGVSFGGGGSSGGGGGGGGGSGW